MSDLVSLNRELSRYRVLRDNVSVAVSYLNKSFDALDVAAIKIGDYYTIDDARADSNDLLNCRSRIDERKSYLSNTVIPAIDREIVRLKKAIEDAEAEMVL